jgi:hypothetical protein
MRLQDLYETWDRFNAIIDNPRLDGSVKQVLGGELIAALPPVMLCGSFSLSRVQLEADMMGRLADLKERNGRTRKEAEAETRQTGNRKKT